MHGANKKQMLRNIRQALVVTLVLLLLCGFVFPVLLSAFPACFSRIRRAQPGDRRRQGCDVLKIEGDGAEAVLAEAGFAVLAPEEVYCVDPA